MKEFLKDILRQLTGRNFRTGELDITWYANIQMNELRLDFKTIEDVFRHGRKVESMVQNYGDYSISISYRWDATKKQYIIISVRKFLNENNKLSKYPKTERRWDK